MQRCLYDENTEVFVNDDEGHEHICINFDVLKDEYFLHGKLQPIVIKLIGECIIKNNVYQ